MSPPIFTPDGSEVSEIVLPDGSTASEVIGPDGNVVFEAGPDIPDSGVFRLTFDDADTDSGSAFDVWNNNDGFINGATTGVAGIAEYDSGQAYDFDGTNDSVTISPVGSQSTYSASVWVELDQKNTGSSQQLISGDDNLNDIRQWQLRESGGSFEFVHDISGSPTTISTSASTAITHLVAVQDSSGGRLYKDGSQVASSAQGSNSVDPTITVGYKPDTNYADGVIDDPRYYSKALTDTEVSNLYSTGSI